MRTSLGDRRIVSYPVAVAQRFYNDQCLTRASALAYVSLLSIVPLFAVMFAVLKGLGVQHRLEPLMLSRLSLAPETTEAIIGYIDRTNVTTLGALGAAMLVLTVVSVLGSIESSFNYIWRVERSRSLWRQVTDYMSVVMLTPFLLLAAGALTSTLHVQQIIDWLTQTRYVGEAVVQGLRLIPVLINAVALGILYAIMPNRRPSVLPIVVSALVAGLAWQLVQMAYVALQIGVARYNAIYGALSQLPVTLVWLYVSWVIVLGGAEIAAVIENGPNPVGPSRWSSAAVTLHILLRVGQSFASGGAPLEARELARELGVSLDVVNEALADLERRGWITAVADEPARFVLVRDAAQIDLRELIDLTQTGSLPRGCDARVHEVLRSVAQGEEQAWGAWRLADLLKSDSVPNSGAEPV